jgi:hypothetical protein
MTYTPITVGISTGCMITAANARLIAPTRLSCSPYGEVDELGARLLPTRVLHDHELPCCACALTGFARVTLSPSSGELVIVPARPDRGQPA